ncbi:MAG TPA: hypothetical protein IAC25_02540 [Candidatus Enterenecus stercoripullorum]|nr:hypothetical protein [Candidatus Enterenecus stercoripullorum]
MAKIMTAAAFVAKAKEIATGHKTTYMLGPWGWPCNQKMITRATTNGSNAQTNKQWLSYAYAIEDEGFIFDCVGLIKGILWGWSGDMSRTYGGAGYACNGLPDLDAGGMIKSCPDVSTDFSNIVPGEVVYMPGHIGIYVGDGVVSESTPKWNWGVQLSTCTNVSKTKVPGTVGQRTWTSHGRIPWVDYETAEETKEDEDDMVRYERLSDIPEGSDFRAIINDLMDAKIINGDGSDPDGNEDRIDLSHDMVRLLVFNYRAGVYEEAIKAAGKDPDQYK